MTEEQFKNLQQGDLVRGGEYRDVLQVTGNYGGFAVAVRTVVITHPGDWDLISVNKRASAP